MTVGLFLKKLKEDETLQILKENMDLLAVIVELQSKALARYEPIIKGKVTCMNLDLEYYEDTVSGQGARDTKDLIEKLLE